MDMAIAEAARELGLARIGVVSSLAPAGNNNHNGSTHFIYRLRQHPPGKAAVAYDHLMVSDNADDASHADLVTVSDFGRVKDRLKKKAKAGVGLEMTVAQARRMDAAGVARWLADVSALAGFCHSSGCQLVLSSGATSRCEMVSGRSFDALLRTCGIDPERHWAGLEKWLESRLSGRRVRVR